MSQLVFLGKEFNGRAYQLQLERTTVGRSDDNTLVIQHKSVSHHHCEILTYGNEVIVRDLGSTNGTFLDDARLKPQAGARTGQIIRFGDVEARLVVDSMPEEGSDVTAVHEHARAVRDQRREKARQTVDPKAVVGDPDAETTSSGTGTLLHTPAPRPEPAPTPAPTTGAAPPPARSTLWWWLIVIVAAVLVWLLFNLA